MLRFLLACVLTATAHAQEQPIDWREAASCVGHVCAIRGTVAVTDPDGAAIRLYFDAQRRDVRVLLMRGWLVTWPQYDGQTIVAIGKVGRFRDHIEVTVVDPRDVTVVGQDVATPATPTGSTPSPPPPTQLPPTPPPATPPASTQPPPTLPAAPPSPPPGEVEELRQRVRELEQRVRELEGQ
jgi:hypothetical protein